MLKKLNNIFIITLPIIQLLIYIIYFLSMEDIIRGKNNITQCVMLGLLYIVLICIFVYMFLWKKQKVDR